jgi:hypothetical protein
MSDSRTVCELVADEVRPGQVIDELRAHAVRLNVRMVLCDCKLLLADIWNVAG